MMIWMRRTFQAFFLPLALAILVSTSFAAADDDDAVQPDARLEGYTHPGPAGPLVITPSSGTSTTWILVVLLGAATIGVMCKSGNRTHLD